MRRKDDQYINIERSNRLIGKSFRYKPKPIDKSISSNHLETKKKKKKSPSKKKTKQVVPIIS